MTIQRVLVVDDAPADRLMLTRCLRARQPGLEIVQVCRAEEGLEYLTAHSVDCLFLDIHLPGKTGIELLHLLRRDGQMPCAVVAMTGSGSDQLAVDALKSGAHDYLPKSRVNEVSLWDAITYSVSRFELQMETRQRQLELQDLNAELQRKDRIKTQFVANASHELRTPVAAIVGLLGLMQRTDVGEDQQKLLTSMKSCCDSLLLVVDDLIDLTKIESGALELHERPFHLKNLLDALLGTVRILAHDKGLQLSCQLEPGLPAWLLGDPSRLRQILYNLVGNAIKFTPTGFVRIRASCPAPGRLRCEIHDSGIGITEAEQERLFEPHFQAGSLDEKSQGSGLGLAIVRSLLKRMGGQVGVESPCVWVPDAQDGLPPLAAAGQGSTFWFELPLAAAEEPLEEPTDQPQDGQHARGFQLLVAEDNPIAARVLALQLQHLGHQVTVVSDGRSAVEQARSRKFQAIIMDCQMPELDGFQATRELRQSFTRETLPIIALTANALLGESARCEAAGMNDYLVKPVTVSDLQRLLEQWVSA